MCSILSAQEICLSIQIAPASSQNDFMKLNALLDSGENCYDPLPGQHSFSYIFISCYIFLPGILLLCLSSLPSYPRAPHIYCMCPLTPMPFLVLLSDRGYPFSFFSVMDAYSSSQCSHIDYVFLLLIYPSLMFHDFSPLLSRTFYLIL